MIDVRNDKGELIGKANYLNGKLHGRAFRYFPNTLVIHEEHNYINGVKHGECTIHNGSFRYVEHYNYGELFKTQSTFETDVYFGMTEKHWEELPPGHFVGGYFNSQKEIRTVTKVYKNKETLCITETKNK